MRCRAEQAEAATATAEARAKRSEVEASAAKACASADEEWEVVFHSAETREADASSMLLWTDADMHEAANLWLSNENAAEQKYGNIKDWDTSRVTDMSYMFSYVRAFNGDVSKWDVSSVTNMDSMFLGAAAFNGDVSKWDVSSVTDMSQMFKFIFPILLLLLNRLYYYSY
jgi:surface protein